MSEDQNKTPMDDEMEEFEVDVVTFVDDDGKEYEMEVVEYFEHKDKKYALLAEFLDDEALAAHGEDCDCEDDLFIFEVKEDNEGLEYVAIEDDDLLDELTVVVEEMGLFGDMDEE